MIPLLFNLAFSLLLLAVAIIDIKTMTIPDKLTLSVGVVCLLWIGLESYHQWLQVDTHWYSPLLSGLGGGLLGGGLLFLADQLSLWLVGKDGFGYGDVKLMLACGLVLGWQLVLVALWVAFVSGAVVGVAVLQQRKRVGNPSGYMAFGPFLCLGAWVAWLWGPSLLNWWLG